MRTWILALIVIGMTGTPALAVECLDPSPKKLPIWQDFESFVEKEYYQGRKGGGGRRYAFGHALGRLASAVQGQPDRHQAFACVQLVLERKISHLVLFGKPESARVLFSTVMEAAMGMHNEKVVKFTGVTSTEPLYHLFGGKIKNPTTPPKVPKTVVKTQPGQPKKKSGTIIKSQPGVLPPVPSGGSSANSGSGSTPQCIAGANWSLEVADKAIVDAWDIRLGNPIPDCRGSNWTVCKNIMTQLSIARDHIFQTFDQNHDGKNDCKIRCLFDAAAGRAKVLIAWEDWLRKRYFSGAGGLSTIYYTINERRGIPMCKQKPGKGSVMAGGGSASVSGSGSGASTPSAGGLHVCNDPSVPTSARWKFYRYIFGGGGTSYPEKKGLICYTSTSYYTYAGGGLKHYICDDGMVNCRRSDKKEYIYTKIVTRDTGTEYQYADQGGYAVRSPEGDAPEEVTIIVAGGEESVETDETMQAGINFRGSDLKNFFLDQAQPGLCRDACEKNERCQAWTYVKPGEQGKKAKCWLKHSVPKPQKDSCCVSGVAEAALNDAANALVAVKACSNANIETGKEWAFGANIGVSRYYMHSGHLCEKGGERVMKVAGKKLIGYTCLGGWKGCKRNRSYDADLIYPAVDYQWGKRAFLKLKIKWRGMNERELYIEK